MKNGITVWGYIDRKIISLKEDGRKVTAGNYSKCKYRLWCYCQDESLAFENITEALVNGFNSYLKLADIQNSTISFYNRVLRSIYNQAAKEGLVKNVHPFDYVYTGVDRAKSVCAQHADEIEPMEGETGKIARLSKNELLRRYTTLLKRYSTLVNQLGTNM